MDDLWVVRVVGPHGGWTTKPMPSISAKWLQEQLKAEIEGIGDDPTLMPFDACGGRHITFRARDVIAVERCPYVPSGPAPQERAHIPSATEYLRRQSAARTVEGVFAE